MSDGTAPAAGFVARRRASIVLRGSSVRVEVQAGIATFLSIVYILAVGPAILSQAGIGPRGAFLATAIAACATTLAMGLWADLPFAVAPGLSMSSYFTFVVVQKLHFTPPQALACVFISGAVALGLTTLPVRRQLVENLPTQLKQAITLAIGAFLLAIGLLIANLAGYGSNVIHPGAISTVPVATFLTGLALSFLLRRVLGGTALTIAGATIVYHLLGGTTPPPAASQTGWAIGTLSFTGLASGGMLASIIVFVVLDFFEGVGEFVGLTSGTSMQDAAGNIPHVERGLYVDGLGTMLGALLGTSSLVIFVESAIGIRAGGRTGLTAIVCGLLLSLTACIGYRSAALLTLVPAVAASGVLAYAAVVLAVGWARQARATSAPLFDQLAAAGMGLLTLLTFSLSLALAFGFLAYASKALLPRMAGPVPVSLVPVSPVSVSPVSVRQTPPALLVLMAAVLVFAVLWQFLHPA